MVRDPFFHLLESNGCKDTDCVFYICGTAGSAGCDGGEVEAGCIPYRIWRIIRSLK